MERKRKDRIEFKVSGEDGSGYPLHGNFYRVKGVEVIKATAIEFFSKESALASLAEAVKCKMVGGDDAAAIQKAIASSRLPEKAGQLDTLFRFSISNGYDAGLFELIVGIRLAEKGAGKARFMEFANGQECKNPTCGGLTVRHGHLYANGVRKPVTVAIFSREGGHDAVAELAKIGMLSERDAELIGHAVTDSKLPKPSGRLDKLARIGKKRVNSFINELAARQGGAPPAMAAFVPCGNCGNQEDGPPHYDLNGDLSAEPIASNIFSLEQGMEELDNGIAAGLVDQADRDRLAEQLKGLEFMPLDAMLNLQDLDELGGLVGVLLQGGIIR